MHYTYLVPVSRVFTVFKMADEVRSDASAVPSSLTCYALRLKPGDDITDMLDKFVADNNLKAAFVLSCVGSVTSATLRMAHATARTNEIKNLSNDRYEIVSLVGTLSAKGHLHASLSDKDGNIIGGHVMGNMIVFTTAEIVIGECCELVFDRQMDNDTGFNELVVQPRKLE